VTAKPRSVIALAAVLLAAITSAAPAAETITPMTYCDGRPDSTCPVGHEITLVVPMAADWDLGGDGRDEFEPHIFGTTTVRFRPALPTLGTRHIAFRASDGSDRRGEMRVYIPATTPYLHRHTATYCDGHQQGAYADRVECRVGQEVKLVAPIPAAWNPNVAKVWIEPFQPAQSGLEFRHRYAAPGRYLVDYRSLDGTRFGFAEVNIAPLSLLSREPAFASLHSSFALGRDLADNCTVLWLRGYRAYRDHTYRAGLTIHYRYRKRIRRAGRPARTITRTGRFLRQRRPAFFVTPASESQRTVRTDDHPDGYRPLTYDPFHGTKVAWLTRIQADVFLTLRERFIQTNGDTLYANTITRRMNLAKCRLRREVVSARAAGRRGFARWSGSPTRSRALPG
jgi:hypothetical protein